VTDQILGLDRETIERARHSRDPRFDGRFFIGVKTTGIYCRPVCPVKTPKRENVEIYSSAAAAGGAGYRPCMRCRPELAPGQIGWTKSGRHLLQALNLIDREILNGISVDEIAAELQVSTRQLNRVFRQYLGTTPFRVAQTKRLHFAKQLIDETRLSMTEICFAAGFGSIRRFNDVFNKTYGQSPSRLRKRRKSKSSIGQGVAVTLSYRLPFDWRYLLQFLSRRAISGMEVCGPTRYQRTIEIGTETGQIAVEFSIRKPEVRVLVDFPDTTLLLGIIERVRNLFDLNADSRCIDQTLAADSLIGDLVNTWPGVRVPGVWDGFEVAVRAIVGQQISVPAATTLLTRLVSHCGKQYAATGQNSNINSGTKLTHLFPTPQEILASDIRGMGISDSRVEVLYSLCREVVSGNLRFDTYQDIESVKSRFKQIKGVGDWTAEYVAMRALRDPNGFPHGDLILRRVATTMDASCYGDALLKKSRSWEPWRAYATMLMWRKHQEHQSQSVRG